MQPPAVAAVIMPRPAADDRAAASAVVCNDARGHSQAAAGDGAGGPGDRDIAEGSDGLQKAVFGPLQALYKTRWEDSKRIALGRVVLEHLQLLLIVLQPQFLWTFDASFWCGAVRCGARVLCTLCWGA